MSGKTAPLTLKDIAKALNLSTSTVSKSLRDSYEIGEETKRRVLSFAKEAGYSPNPIARSLKEGRSYTIGVVICFIKNTFVAEMLEGIDKICNEKGYSILIMQSKESAGLEKEALRLLNARAVDGLLISPAYDSGQAGHINNLIDQGLPVVLFDRLTDAVKSVKVGVNNYQASYDATCHLIQNGYRKIALLHSETELSISIDRREGYLQALKDHHIAILPGYLQTCPPHPADQLEGSIRRSIESLLQLESPPHALLTTTDQISTKTMAVLHKMGIRIPEDMALMGFSNTGLADLLSPPLSTVYQPASLMGEIAAKELIRLVEKKQEDPEIKTTLLDVEIVPRASTRRL